MLFAFHGCWGANTGLDVYTANTVLGSSSQLHLQVSLWDLPSQFEKQRNQNNQDTPEEKRALALPRDGEGGCSEHTMVVTTKPPSWLSLLLGHEEG